MGFRRNMTEALAGGAEALPEAAFGGVHGGDGQSGKNGISAMCIRAGHWGEDFVPSVMVLFMWIC